MIASRCPLCIILLVVAVAAVTLAPGCGSDSGGTLRIGRPMESGDATVKVTRIAAAKALRTSGGEDVSPQLPGQVFLLVTFDIRNTSDRAVVVVDPWISKKPAGSLLTAARTITSTYEKQHGVALNGTGLYGGEALPAGAERKEILAVYTVTPPSESGTDAGKAPRQSTTGAEEVFPGGECYFVVASRTFPGMSVEPVVTKFFSGNRQTGKSYAISPFPAPAPVLTFDDIRNRNW